MAEKGLGSFFEEAFFFEPPVELGNAMSAPATATCSLPDFRRRETLDIDEPSGRVILDTVRVGTEAEPSYAKLCVCRFVLDLS